MSSERMVFTFNGKRVDIYAWLSSIPPAPPRWAARREQKAQRALRREARRRARKAAR